MTAANCTGRLGDALAKASRHVHDMSNGRVEEPWAEAQNVLDHAFVREQATLNSILDFNAESAVRGVVVSLQKERARQYASHSNLLKILAKTEGGVQLASPSDPKSDPRVPVRLSRGPLGFGLPQEKLTRSERAWYEGPEFTLDGTQRFELVNFIDGKRSVSEIRNALSAEFAPVELRVVAHYLEDLVNVGMLKWRE